MACFSFIEGWYNPVRLHSALGSARQWPMKQRWRRSRQNRNHPSPTPLYETGATSEWADRALHDQPRLVGPRWVKIAANAHLGRLDEARAELSRVLATDAKLTIAGFREYAHFMAPEVLELYVDGLRLAGLPEK
jgi:hypothetical protein